jgi:outer membrane protein insertion porin family
MNRVLRILLPAMLILLAAATLAPARAGDLHGVEVRGNKRVETDAIRLAIKSQAGEPLDPAKVAADIKAIFALGYFDNIRAEVEQRPEGAGAVLVFAVTEKPSIAKIDYQGYDELDLDKIKEVVDIQPLSVLNVAKIRKNADKIKELYVEKGFFLADVDHKLKKLAKNRVALTFVIRT